MFWWSQTAITSFDCKEKLDLGHWIVLPSSSVHAPVQCLGQVFAMSPQSWAEFFFFSCSTNPWSCYEEHLNYCPSFGIQCIKGKTFLVGGGGKHLQPLAGVLSHSHNPEQYKCIFWGNSVRTSLWLSFRGKISPGPNYRPTKQQPKKEVSSLIHISLKLPMLFMWWGPSCAGLCFIQRVAWYCDQGVAQWLAIEGILWKHCLDRLPTQRACTAPSGGPACTSTQICSAANLCLYISYKATNHI